MKNSTKIFIFFAIITILDIGLSCCPETVDHGIFKYTHCDIETLNVDNSGNEPRLMQTGNVPKEAYGISLYFLRSINECEYTGYQSILFPSAYALTKCYSEDVSTYLPLDYITDIEIITINDFDNDHLENSDVSDKFYVFKDTEFYSITDYLSDNDFTFQGRDSLDESLLLLLMEPPTINTEHKFLVKVHLSDGRVLSSTTPSINLQ